MTKHEPTIKIIVASKNPVKINAVEESFKKIFLNTAFSIEGISVPSGVKDQPMTDEETLAGAMNRATNAEKEKPEANYWIGIEGGIEEREEELQSFAWIVIKTKNKTGKAKTATFVLPEKIRQLIKEGKELGEADDIVFKKTNSKQRMGAVGLLTKNILTRQKYYEDAIIFAAIPFINKELY